MVTGDAKAPAAPGSPAAAYVAVVQELKRRIMAVMLGHCWEIGTMGDASGLFKIPGFNCDDLRPIPPGALQTALTRAREPRAVWTALTRARPWLRPACPPPPEGPRLSPRFDKLTWRLFHAECRLRAQGRFGDADRVGRRWCEWAVRTRSLR